MSQIVKILLDNTDPPYGQYKLILLFANPFIVS